MIRAILLLVLLTSLLPASPVLAKTLSKVVAVVNRDIISSYQLDKAVLAALEKHSKGNQLTAQQFDQLRENVLEQLINEKLAKQRIKELGLQVGEAELDAAIEDVQRKNNLTRSMLENALQAQGMDFESYRATLRDEILRYKLLGREVNYKVQVTSGEVRDYFREHIDEFRATPKVRVSHISFPLPATEGAELTALRKQAEVTRDLLLSGEPRDKVAATLGEGASINDMGELVEAELTQELQAALSGLEVGQVSQPLELNGQLHLFLITDRNPGDINLFDRVKGEIEQRIEKEKTDARFKEWAQELRDNGYVDIRI
ncbi:MAG TPA: SurA N-terminal domain-containing protein [Malonomonas sp.]